MWHSKYFLIAGDLMINKQLSKTPPGFFYFFPSRRRQTQLVLIVTAATKRRSVFLKLYVVQTAKLDLNL